MLRAIALVLLMTASANAEGSRGPIGLKEGNAGVGAGPSRGGVLPTPREATDAEKKAKEEMEARDRRWDAKMRKTMSGVCRGC